MALLIGTANGDILTGTSGRDRIFGNAGADIIDGGKGRDELHGGDDNDILFGGEGIDELHGGKDDVTSTAAPAPTRSMAATAQISRPITARWRACTSR